MSFNPQLYLQYIHPHERDDFITFDEGPHIYTIQCHKIDPITGEKIVYYDSNFTSVTTWIHSLFPSFDEDKIINNMMKSKKWPQNKYYGMNSNEIKSLWESNRNDAAKAGTMMHYDIECFYNNNIPNNNSIEFKYFMNFERNRTKPGGFGVTWKPYRTEWMVFDEELRLSGSIDMLFEDEYGNLKIFDWKRSREIKKTNIWENANVECISHLPNSNFWHYSLQLNIYKKILERNYNKNVDVLSLVCLHPDNKNMDYQIIKVPILNMELDDLIKYRIASLS